MINPFKKVKLEIKYYTRTGVPLRNGKGFTQLPFCGEHKVFVRPGESSTIMMGISVNLPESVGAMIMINPGMTAAMGLYQDFVEVLPPGYMGEVRIRVVNRGKQIVYIAPAAYIAMIIPFSIPPFLFSQRGMREVDPVGYNNLPD